MKTETHVSTVERGAPAVCAVLPRDPFRLSLRPLSAASVSIGPGFWRSKLEVNRDASLIHAARELEAAGNLHNFRVAAGWESGGYRGFSAIGIPYLFLDSDVYKWLEAVSWELGHPERGALPQIERLADETIALLAAAQRPDGYLNTYFQITTPGRRFHELVTGHELYCAGHLLQAGVAHYRATGATTLLRVAERNADCLYREFMEVGNPGLPAHPGLEMALVELYRTTGDARHLRLALTFIDRRGQGLLGFGRFGAAYYQDDVPIREAQAIRGHAVMALYLASGLVDAYVETGDETLIRPVLRQWTDLTSTKTYITGGIGSRHREESIGDPYELPPDRAYCETCAAIGSVMLAWRLLLVSGEGKYADLIERTLYNAVLPGVSLDGSRFFYVNPLQVRSAHIDPPDGIGSAVRQSWFHCACCPPNVMRTLSSLEQYVASVSAEGVQIHQYVPGEVAVALGPEETVRLEIETDYPWQGSIKVRVREGPRRPWELGLRVPGWAADTARATGPNPSGGLRPVNGYLKIRRGWEVGDVVTLELPLLARWTSPLSRIDAVRDCVALERGPLVYCFEQSDQPAGVDLDDIEVDPARVEEERSTGVLGPLVLLRCTGAQATAPQTDWPYVAGPSALRMPASRSVTLCAIPYFAWANRARSAMRVWMPQRRTLTHAAEEH